VRPNLFLYYRKKLKYRAFVMIRLQAATHLSSTVYCTFSFCCYLSDQTCLIGFFYHVHRCPEREKGATSSTVENFCFLCLIIQTIFEKIVNSPPIFFSSRHPCMHIQKKTNKTALNVIGNII
jgi:hypothetical protein